MSLRGRAPDALKGTGRAAAGTLGRLTSGARMLPDFLVAGAQRCGTTSLYRTLSGHPDVVPPLFAKGVHYFDTADAYAKGLDWYRGHFPVRVLAERRAPGRPVTGEGSPYYMFHPLAAGRIARDLPDTRLVVLLRDPVERAFSAHKQETGRGFETEPFERALALEPQRLAGEVERILADPTYQSFAHQHHAYVARGEYATQLRRMRQLLGEDRVLVLDADDFFARPSDQWGTLLQHLGLPPWQPAQFEHANARPSAPMPAHVRERLTEHFRPHDGELAVLLGRVPSWRR